MNNNKKRLAVTDLAIPSLNESIKYCYEYPPMEVLNANLSD